MEEERYERFYAIMCVYTLGVIIVTSLVWWLVFGVYKSKLIEKYKTEQQEIVTDSLKTNVDALIDAFIYVESRGDIKAKNGKHIGCIQIAPIMVDEANRILGMNKYTLSDRESKEKSIEIFKIVQEYYNPEYDLHKACKVWNPTSNIKYHNRVENKYNELINKQ